MASCMAGSHKKATFPPWEDVHHVAQEIIKKLDRKYRPYDRIDSDEFVSRVLTLSWTYYLSETRREKYRGSTDALQDQKALKGWLNGNVCLSAAKDVREQVLGRKIPEKGVLSSKWERRDTATG